MVYQLSAKKKKIVNKVLSQPVLAHGNETKKFGEFKKFTKASLHLPCLHAAGMHLFYLANNIKKGDEVILQHKHMLQLLTLWKRLVQNQFCKTLIKTQETLI